MVRSPGGGDGGGACVCLDQMQREGVGPSTEETLCLLGPASRQPQLKEPTREARSGPWEEP